MKETDINSENYTACRFYPQEILQCVDLALPSVELTFWERYSFVLFYPLIMACGLKVKIKEDSFKPEYIIPQLLFQVVTQHSDLAGISYTSTRYDDPNYKDMQQRNFVMIIRNTVADQGYSKELGKLFNMTDTTSPQSGETSISVEHRLKKMEHKSLNI